MAIKNKSVAITGPEFMNLQSSDVNPLMSKCDIKVLYTGHNRNDSHIDKPVAEKMATTLRGSPIVGYYRTDKADFGDHGHQLIIDINGVQEKVLTIPYGYVAPDAKVWFQWFTDTDEFGNAIDREYLMCEGYIWNGQFAEAQKILNEGQPQSMELGNVDGHWSTDSNLGKEFFIITDAIFTKLCVLGDDVEPCFEGADIKMANTFSLVDEEKSVKDEILNIFKQLNFTLEGGQIVMDNEVKVTEEMELDTPSVENSDTDTFSEAETTETVTEEFKADDKEEKDEDKDGTSSNDADSGNEEDKDEDDKKKPVTENSLVVTELEETTPIEETAEYKALQTSYDNLQAEFIALKTNYAKLEEFYNNAMLAQKDALIEKFYMLSDEDKRDVIENKNEYSLEEIESKLSVICFRKKVNFDLEDTSKNDNKINNTDTLMFNVNTDDFDNTPAWIKAVESNKKV